MKNNKRIPYSCQWIDEKDIEAVVSVLKSDFITQGPKVAEFEEKFAKKVGSKYAVAVANGTAGLHLAALALDLKEGDEVITSPISFLATSNAAFYVGAKPIFADIDPKTLCLDVKQVKKKITPKTKAIFPVHFAGQPAALEELSQLCKKHGLYMVEDACHALGAQYKQSMVGDCQYSNMAVFSFHPVKHLATGEGGMVTTNSENLYQKLCDLRSHGMVRDRGRFELNDEGPWCYEMQSLGFNYRMTDMQAALGVSQLEKIDMFVSKRREIANRYIEAFKELKLVRVPEYINDTVNSHHLFIIQLNLRNLNKTRAEIFEALKSEGLGLQIHYIPIARQPFYKKKGYNYKDYPVAESFYKSTISIPLFPKMTEEEVDYVISIVKKILS